MPLPPRLWLSSEPLGQPRAPGPGSQGALQASNPPGFAVSPIRGARTARASSISASLFLTSYAQEPLMDTDTFNNATSYGKQMTGGSVRYHHYFRQDFYERPIWVDPCKINYDYALD